jgi:predicted permease
MSAASPGGSPTPPRWARRLLALTARREDRGYMLDDLQEEFATRAERDGLAAARRWYRAQVVASLPHALARRFDRLGGLPPRRRRDTRAGHRVREALRPRSRDLSMDALLQDFRFAARSFLRRPGFTLVALATLSVAIAANTAIFSVANGVLLKHLPGVPTAERIVEIAGGGGDRFTDLPYPLVREMAASAGTLDAVAALDWSPFAVGGGDRPEVRLGAAVTYGYFDVLGTTASQGRLFTSEEASYPSVRPVAVISESLRAQRFADEEIPGATIVVNGTPLDVVGVAADGFRGHTLTPLDVFVPLGLPIPGLTSESALSTVDALAIQVLGRLRPGTSREAAAQELTAMGRAMLGAEAGEVPADFAIRVDAWGGVPAPARLAVAAFLTALLLLVGLVLALACINVAGMVLSRSAERGDEIAVRVAMGAGRGRIVRQLLSEATLLALVAGGVALPLSAVVTRLLLAFEPPLPPGFQLTLDFAIDGRVLAFSFVVAVGSAVLFNLAPALGAARTDVMAAIKGGAGTGTRSRTRVRSALVAGQMGFALVLLATAGLFLRGLSAAKSLDTGWEADGVYTSDIDLELTGTSEAEGEVFFRDLTDGLAGAPGVESVALANKLPLGGMSSFGDVVVEGVQPPEGRDGFEAFFNRVSPEYFRTLRLTLLQGRDFTDADATGTPAVTVVNRTMAGRLWTAEEAVGKTFRVIRGRNGNFELTVVGVVEDARYGSLFESTPSVYYLPTGQWYNAHMALLVRPSTGREEEVAERVGRIVASLQPHLPRQPLAPLSSTLSLALTPQRIAAWVGGVLGMVALLLGAVGVYGVTAFAVSQRVREIGIRMALGATRRDVVAMVLGQSMIAPAAGLAAGLLGAFAIARVVSGVMPGMSGADPAAFAAAGAALVGVALVATFVPAWRAARSSPVSSLRTE